MRAILILLGLCCFPIFSKGQSQTFFSGVFPEVSLTKKLSNENRINFKIENQEILFDNRMGDVESIQFTHYRTDLMAFHDWRLNSTKSMAIGVFYRFQDGADAKRLIQQYALIQRLRNLRLSHRFRTDQTFAKQEKIEVRFRYRLALEIPLNGMTLDPGEHYFVISNEPIFSLQNKEFELENRFVFGLGKLYSKGQKLEWSIDYRTDGFIQNDLRTRLWLKIGYFQSF